VKVPAVCCAPKRLEIRAARTVGPTTPVHWEHNSRRHLIRIVPPVPDLWLCFTHANCICNQQVSAANRVLGKVPLPTEQGVRSLRAAAKRLFRHLHPIVPWDEYRVAMSFRGPRQRRYMDAYESLKLDPLTKRDARISAFVKSEKFNPTDKENPDPRMIQYRGHRYNIRLAKYLRPIEHQVYRMKINGRRMFAKGLNGAERAAVIWEKFQAIDGCVCYSLDGSRWDKHVDRKTLEVEHAVYKRLAPDPELYQLLDWQLVNSCSTMEGVRWKREGGRMSGDVNTALGNCVLMAAMVHAFAREVGLKVWDMLDDGDDCLLFIRTRDEALVASRISEVFLSYGQELKLENRAETPEQIVFCQSRPVHDGVEWRMVRNWRKVLAQGTSGVKHWNNPLLVRPMMTAVGHCELALSAGLPILQEYAAALIRMGRGERMKWLDVDAGLAERARAEVGDLDLVYMARERPVTLEARLSFERAYGVASEVQVAIEGALREWNISTTVARLVDTEWDHRWVDMSGVDVQLPEVL